MAKAALLAFALLAVAGCEANFNCNPLSASDTAPKKVCYTFSCEKAIQDHIQYEFDAAFTYLAMGAHFAQESVNRPGIAKFLLSAASEERSHAILMLDYLNKRGIELTKKNKNYKYSLKDVDQGKLNKLVSIDYKDALAQALNMEIDVTKKIHKVIDSCGTDFHGADVFTNPILDEQHEGVRHLQGAIKTFNNLAEGTDGNTQFKSYAEYTFDMMLLKGEIAAH